jgi:cell division septation protein DedD
MLDKDATDVFLVKEDNPEAANQQQAISEKNYPKEDLERLTNETGIITLRSVISEQEYFKKQIQDYENKVKKASTITYISLSFGIVAFLSSVVMGILVSSVQTNVSKLTELVSILEEDMSSIAEKNSDLEINNSDSSLEQLNQKVNGFPEQSEKQTLSSSDISKNEMTADVTKQSTVNKSLDNRQAKSPVSEKEKPSEAVKKVSPENKANNTQNAAGWSVNLTAYEDRSYAKSKAAKYLQKGIPVKVIAVDMNNTTWYRLKVGGFKNKEEATSYADKIKKSLNLNSVSVVNN